MDEQKFTIAWSSFSISWIFMGLHGSSLLHGILWMLCLLQVSALQNKWSSRCQTEHWTKRPLSRADYDRLWRFKLRHNFTMFLCNPLSCNSNDQLLTANMHLYYTDCPKKRTEGVGKDLIAQLLLLLMCATFFQRSTCYASPIPVLRRTGSILFPVAFFSTLSMFTVYLCD